MIRDYKKNIYMSFIAGNIFSIGLSFYRQDSMGLDKYVEYITNRWVDTPVIFSAILVLFSVFVFLSCANSPQD